MVESNDHAPMNQVRSLLRRYVSCDYRRCNVSNIRERARIPVGNRHSKLPKCGVHEGFGFKRVGPAVEIEPSEDAK